MKIRWNELMQVLFVAWGLLFFFASGYIDTMDADPSILTARSLFEKDTFRVAVKDRSGDFYRDGITPGLWNCTTAPSLPLIVFPFVTLNQTYPNFPRVDRACPKDPSTYSKMGFAYPLIYLGVINVAHWLPKPWHDGHHLNFLLSLVNPLLTGLIVFLLYFYFRNISISHGFALLSSLSSVVATLLLPYSKSSHREPLQAVCLTGAYLYFLLQDSPRHKNASKLSAVFAVVALLTKQSLVVPLLPLLLKELFFCVRNRTFTDCLKIWCIPFLVWYAASVNFFGGTSLTGYHPATELGMGKNWSQPLLATSIQMLFSSRFGLFLYCPFLIWILLTSFRKSSQTRRRFFVLLPIVLQILFYSRWTSPFGDEALGPRHLVPIIPLFFLLLTPQHFQSMHLRPLKIILFSLLFLPSLAIQLINSSVKLQTYWTIAYLVGEPMQYSHSRANWQLIKHKLKSRPEIYQASTFGFASDKIIDLRGIRSLQGFNFWWLHWRKV